MKLMLIVFPLIFLTACLDELIKGIKTDINNAKESLNTLKMEENGPKSHIGRDFKKWPVKIDPEDKGKTTFEFGMGDKSNVRFSLMDGVATITSHGDEFTHYLFIDSMKRDGHDYASDAVSLADFCLNNSVDQIDEFTGRIMLHPLNLYTINQILGRKYGKQAASLNNPFIAQQIDLRIRSRSLNLHDQEEIADFFKLEAQDIDPVNGQAKLEGIDPPDALANFICELIKGESKISYTLRDNGRTKIESTGTFFVLANHLP